MSKKKSIPVTAQIDELMDARMGILEEQDEMEKIIAEKTIKEREQLKFLGDKLEELDKKIEDIMRDNDIKEFPHRHAYIKYAGTRSIDIEMAKTILPPDIYRAIVKETINVTTAEKTLHNYPEKFEKIIREGKPKLKFNKPKKDVEEVLFQNGVKTVVK